MNQLTIPICIFVRVSLASMSFERQVHELKEYGATKNFVVTETIATKISGYKVDERKDIEKLIEGAKKGLFKKVLVLEVSRIGRRAKEIRSTIDKLHSYGVSIIFKNLGVIESLVDGKESFVTNIIISIYSELAGEERRILVERINSGLEQAKRSGKILGRRKGSSESDEELLKKYSSLIRDLKNGISLRKCEKIHEVSRNTIIKVKRLMN